MNERDLETNPSAGTIGGGWLGTYVYEGSLSGYPAVRFEATVTEPDSDGQFTGSILDDGSLGEADIRGGQSGLGIRFTKTYRDAGRKIVSYEGTLADDGRTVSGAWQIGGAAHGVWDARRAWSNSDGVGAAEQAEEQAEEAAEEWDRPRVREIVRLG